MSYLADSDRLIDALVGRPDAVRTLDRLSAEGVAVSIVSYGEIFEGAYGAPDPAAQLAHFRAYLARFPVVPLSDPVMARFAFHRAKLRDAGLLIPDFDLAIAATALEHDLMLVTRNRRHFGRIGCLRLFEPDDSR